MNYDTIDTIKEIVEGAIKDDAVTDKDRWLEVLRLLGRLREQEKSVVINVTFPKAIDNALFEQRVLKAVASALSSGKK